MADIPKLLEAASRWQGNFQSPLPLGAKSRLAIITCMDSRYSNLALAVAVSCELVHENLSNMVFELGWALQCPS